MPKKLWSSEERGSPLDGVQEGCSWPIKLPMEKPLAILSTGQYPFIDLNFCLTGNYRIIFISSLELILSTSKEH